MHSFPILLAQSCCRCQLGIQAWKMLLQSEKAVGIAGAEGEKLQELGHQVVVDSGYLVREPTCIMFNIKEITQNDECAYVQEGPDSIQLIGHLRPCFSSIGGPQVQAATSQVLLQLRQIATEVSSDCNGRWIHTLGVEEEHLSHVKCKPDTPNLRLESIASSQSQHLLHVCCVQPWLEGVETEEAVLLTREVDTGGDAPRRAACPSSKLHG
mmetsp:Transcript_76743/g.225310  ORF Transcript_76743/g.225310 Transcript_76743/m.225310 type:complete len:211 (-) Transcript_76743:428-1060(-)